MLSVADDPDKDVAELASTSPVVFRSRLFSKAVARKVSLIFIDSFPNPLIPEES